MRWTQFLVPTTKETPKDATAASHVLMLRAGLIRQLAAGLYSYLPLGYRVLRKVEAIVREEMSRAGALELHMPVLQPLSIWEETGRTAAMGDVLLRLGGPAGDWRTQTVLGPTHEEVVTEIARAYLSSYKQLPVNLFQIQTKFRGEARPKSGVLRTREFLMKDAYSFDADKAGLDASYQVMYDAYCRIFSRCGLPYVAVEADSGAIGGDVSHEFMVLTDAGEDTVAVSESGDYAANTERATSWYSSCSESADSNAAPQPLTQIHTPGAGKVDDVCAVLGTTPARMIKTLIFDLHSLRDSGGKEIEWRGWVVALVRGDHELNEVKFRKVVKTALADELILGLEMATPESIEKLTDAKVGFAGPQNLAERVDKLIIDRDVSVMTNAYSGANRTDYHVGGVTAGRDFPLDGDKAVIADIRTVVDGDLSPTGSGAALRLKTAIEVGHVFKLGTKYSEAMKAQFLNRDGKPQPFIMGCYGIGLNRIVAAAIEANHDANGIIWPLTIAPFEVLVISLDPRDEHVARTAAELHDQLAAAGVDVLLDDRDERAGFKFKDADLIGVPIRVVVGKKSLAEGQVEITLRRTPGEKQLASPASAVEAVRDLIRNAGSGA
ncbi:MAG: proline--tRNA ligase [Planctomycetes bacterium]|nr:proline--tRNA ligase [Planctomycetota bacterium]